VAEVKLTKVLIDGGSGLNLIFVSTLKKMSLDFKNMLVPSKSPFYAIVLGNAAHPLGTVVLPVTFGTRENYRTEFIKFEVANFKSSYHAILGRPALAKFVSLLWANRDIFAWKPADMPGVPRELIEHALNVHSKVTPKKQRLRRFAHDKRESRSCKEKEQ
jgi:hypothetical protein